MSTFEKKAQELQKGIKNRVERSTSNDTQKTSYDQNDIYEQLFNEIELAKAHQEDMAAKYFTMLRDIRNQQFFFKELAKLMEADNSKAQVISLYDEKRDNDFFRKSQKSLYGLSQNKDQKLISDNSSAS